MMTSGIGHSSSSGSQHGGFTLLELILVMVVICVVMGMAAPSLRGFWDASKTNDAIAQIVAVTHWARSQAVVEGRVYRLNIDPQAGTYWLSVQEQGEFVDLGTEAGRTFAMPEETHIAMIRADSNAMDYIDFDPSGRTDPATIRVTDRRGEETEIVCLSPSEMFQVLSTPSR